MFGESPKGFTRISSDSGRYSTTWDIALASTEGLEEVLGIAMYRDAFASTSLGLGSKRRVVIGLGKSASDGWHMSTELKEPLDLGMDCGT
jgi:hypothetical protein